MTKPRGVGRRAVSGITWTLLGELVSNVTRIAVVAILGRMLSADEFGVVAVAMTVVLFASRFKEVGLGLALIQRKEIDAEHVATTFAAALILGVGFAVGVFAAAGPIARAYDVPQAADPLRALSMLFLIRGLASTSRFLCQRDLRFRALATINVVAYLTGSTVSVVLAVRGHGLWALVAGYIVEAAVDCLLVLVVRPPTQRPRIRRRALRELFGFGGGHTLASFANYFANQGDYIVVGRFLGETMLGVYNRAYELMRFPAQMFTTVAGTVLFSSFARLQDDPARLGQMFRRVLFANAILLLPASAGLIVLAPEAIRILLGPGWSGAVMPFQIMAASMLCRTSYKAAGLVARSAGAVLMIAAWQAAYAIAVVGGALLSMRWGIVGVSVTTCLAVVFHFTNLTRLALRQVPLGWRAVIGAHRDGLVLAALAAGGALPAALALRAGGATSPVIALVATAAGAVLPIGYAVVQLRRRAPDWTWLFERVRQVARRRRRGGGKGGGKGGAGTVADDGAGAPATRTARTDLATGD